MTVLGIAARSLRQRALSSTLTATSVALGVALAVLVTAARGSLRRSFDEAARGHDVVIGGLHTSTLSTVLSTVFLLDQPSDTVPIEAYEAVRADPRVAHAVPYAVGDVVRGQRVVGTTTEVFDALTDASGRPLRERVRGRVFGDGPAFEAVVGAMASARARLPMGSQFTVTHGLEEGGAEHEERWTVVGLLEPTGTPLDRAVLIPLDSFFRVKGHERHDAPEGVDATEPWAVSSIVVRLKSPALRLSFAADMAKRTDLQAALPHREITRLFAIVSDVERGVRAISAVVLAVAAIGILVGLYNTIQGRRRELAILRAVGARRSHLFAVVVLEAVLLCLAGGLLGIALGRGALLAAEPWLLERFGVRIDAMPGLLDLWVLLVLLGVGLVCGAVPALRAYRTPVAQNLHPVD